MTARRSRTLSSRSGCPEIRDGKNEPEGGRETEKITVIRDRWGTGGREIADGIRGARTPTKQSRAYALRSLFETQMRLELQLVEFEDARTCEETRTTPGEKTRCKYQLAAKISEVCQRNALMLPAFYHNFP